MTLKQQVTQDLERLDEEKLREVADFVAFLEFRTRRSAVQEWDDAELSALYAEFADEDRVLAEAGLSDYAAGLAKEDAAL